MNSTERQLKARLFVEADIRDAIQHLASARRALDNTGLPDHVRSPLASALGRSYVAAQDALKAGRFPADTTT